MTTPYRRSASPPEVAVPTGLGAVLSVHPAQHRVTWVVAAIMALVLTPALAYQSVVAGVEMAAFTVLVIAVSHLLGPRSVALYEDGIEVRRWLGSPLSIRFDEVRTVYRDFGVVTRLHLTGVTSCTWTLVDASGRRVRLPSALSNADPLFLALARRCEQPVMEDAIEAFDEGELLRFGPLSLTNHYLELDKRIIDITELERVEASPLRVFLHVRDRWLPRSVRLKRIPFPFVFLTLHHRGKVEVRGIEGFVTRR